MENQTPEQIAQHYKAMGDSVWLINAVVNGTEMAEATTEDKVATVDRNVRHLQIMIEQDFWTDEDMKPVRLAIAVGLLYKD